MVDTDEHDLDLSRRTVLQGTAGLGTLGLAGTAAGRGNPGGRPPSSPPPGDGGDGDGPIATVTLITGQTVHVTRDGDRYRYELAGEDAGAYRLYDLDDGTYVVPDGADLDRLSPLLFNVDFLVEQGLTDEETDATPVVVEFADDVDASADVSGMAAGGFSATRVLESVGAVAGEVAKDQGRVTTERTLAADAVEQVHLDVRYEALLDDSADVVNAPAARDEFGVDGSGVSVAVLDTGIDADHPDFGDRVVHEADFSGDGTGDAAGHGTHVAGIAAGAGAENGDYVGMAPGADLMNVKVLGDDGSGALSDIVAGIEHAVDQGADVINLSLGGPAQEDGPMAQAVNTAVENGVVAAVAAGNTSGYGTVGSPGIAEKALTVGASEGDSGMAFFSSAGPTPYDYRVKPEVTAPGSGITSTGSEGAGEYPYTGKSGTSMSSPHVAGLAALLLEDDADRSPEDVRDALVSTANPIDGPDVYEQGGGVVDVAAALGADLRVRDAVANFGLFESAGTDSATVTLENTGDEAATVDVSASLENVQSGDPVPDAVSVSPESVTVDPGATETVEVTVDAGDAFGYNSGVLTFETDAATHRAVFGFVRGLEVSVEKLAHPDSDGVAGDGFFAYAHDGSFSHTTFSAFDADGQYSFVVLDDGGDYTFWSSGELAPPEGSDSGEPTWTADEVTVSTDQTSFTIDEGATVPRELDTSEIADDGPFVTRRFDATMYANYDDGPAISASRGFTGDFGITTVHVAPVDEDDPTNVGTTYLFYSENPDAEYTFDTDTGYHLFEGALSIDGPHAITVDRDELAEENFEYHRTYDGQLLGVSPTMYPADLENFPTLFTISFLTDIGEERVEQTWYRNEQARFDESWYDDASFSGDYQIGRAEVLAPEAGASYDQPLNSDPLVDRLTTWDLADETLTLRGQWATDQSDEPFTVFEYAHDSQNEWSVSVDGDTVDSGTSYYWLFPETEVPDVSPGSDLGVSLAGNVLDVTPRATTTVTDFEVTYEPGTANTPPQVDSLDVVGLDTYNEVTGGLVFAFVHVDHEAAGVDEFQAYYAPSGDTSGTPFEDPTGWEEATTLAGFGGFYSVLMTPFGHDGSLDLAVEATDSEGNRVESTSFDALTVKPLFGGATAVPASIQTRPNRITADSSGTVPVVISDAGDVDPADVVVDSLRYGSPDAVHAGEGAEPVRVQRVGRGSLQVHFRAADAGFECSNRPVGALLTGELEDGTPFSAVDVIPSVTCRDE